MSLTYQLDGDVATIVLDDGKANALSPDLIGVIYESLDRAEKEALAVAIFGRPGRFSGGFDLDIMGSDAMPALVRRGGEMMMRLWEFPRPVVVGCTGHAVAAGAMLLLAADYRIGVEGDWKIGLNETAIGMALPDFAIELAKARLDPRMFTRAALHGELYDAEQAVAVGYLDETATADDLFDVTMAHARRMARFAPTGYGPSKAHVRGPMAELVRSRLAEDLKRISPPRL
jgi:enoyl-CoA hydratase